MEQTDASPQSADELFRTAVIFESALGAVAIVLGLVFGPDARDALPRFDPIHWQPIAIGIGGGILAALPMLAIVALVRRLPFDAVRELEELGDENLFKLLTQLSVPQILVVSLSAGVGEELLFRGWLLPAAASWFSAPRWGGAILDVQNHAHVALWSDGQTPAVIAAVVLSSALFGLVHPLTKLYIVLAAAIGIYLSAILLWTDNLLVPIIAHAAYDAVQMIVAKYQSAKELATDTAA